MRLGGDMTCVISVDTSGGGSFAECLVRSLGGNPTRPVLEDTPRGASRTEYLAMRLGGNLACPTKWETSRAPLQLTLTDRASKDDTSSVATFLLLFTCSQARTQLG